MIHTWCGNPSSNFLRPNELASYSFIFRVVRIAFSSTKRWDAKRGIIAHFVMFREKRCLSASIKGKFKLPFEKLLESGATYSCICHPRPPPLPIPSCCSLTCSPVLHCKLSFFGLCRSSLVSKLSLGRMQIRR